MANGNSGCGVAILVGVGIVVVTAIPKPVWITVGVLAALALISVVIKKSMSAYEQYRQEEEKQQRQRQQAQAAADKLQREANARRVQQQRIEALGADNAALVESAQVAINRVAGSEAARAGWLGDVDFTPDITGITEGFRKAHSLRKVAHQLSALDKPSDDDRTILAEAQATAAQLQRAATERIALIQQCATEAKLVDASLRQEREDARTAEERAQLHATLSSMLYGIEAAPSTAAGDSTADAVIARVQAYREIKNQIQLARD